MDLLFKTFYMNRPDGTTHYSMSDRKYFKLQKNKDYVFKNGGWYLLHSKPPKDTTPIDQPNVKH